VNEQREVHRVNEQREDVQGDDVQREVGAGLAEERTALAWTRTGLSFTVAGVVLLRLLRGSGRLEVGLATGFVVLGAVAWLWGWHAPEARPAGRSAVGRSVMRTLAIGTALVAVAAGFVLSS